MIRAAPKALPSPRPPAQCRDKSSAVALHPPRTRARTWHYVLFLFRVRSPLLREPHKIIHTRVVKPREPDEHVARDVALAGLVVGIADLRAAQIVRQALLCQVAVLSLVSNASIHFASLHPEFVFRFCKEVYVKQNVILFYITKRYIIFEGGSMTDYKAMYLLLFNAVTDALEKMDRQNYGEASALLIAAQQKVEELYMDSDDE